MHIKEDRKYTKEHEWVKVDNNIATVGITDYAQGELGDIIFVELPKVGTKVIQMGPFGIIEAVKAVSELFSPITGEVVEINTRLEKDATIINKDPYGEGWIIKVKVADLKQLDALLTPEKYKTLVET
ncbi:MAG: Glycine cleavage system H protein [candidate division Zixibacteria bacterium RBG-1]|nr:MAG: Glycine cleavage system H protein [candidate division Zixibacteria bacterium RBG-1]OGC85786.1 MAG: glycine cleavage system protein H [candidate division Zixibacteria bacterium RBG_19FT_COMBO_42_43]